MKHIPKKILTVVAILTLFGAACGKKKSDDGTSTAAQDSGQTVQQRTADETALDNAESSLAGAGYKFETRAVQVNEWAKEFRFTWNDETLQLAKTLPVEKRKTALTSYSEKTEAFLARYCDTPLPSSYCDELRRKLDLVANETAALN